MRGVIKSMTGYGSGEKSTDKYLVKIEFKSLNGKYLELNIRAPKNLGEKEVMLRNHFGQKLQRGSVLLIVNIERVADQEEAIVLNKELAAAYYRQISSLAEDLDAPDDGVLLSVLDMPDVLKSEDPELTESDWSDVLDAGEMAFKALDDFRIKEGENLRTLLENHCLDIQQLNEEVTNHEADRKDALRSRLLMSLKENFGDEGYDANRFEQELLYYLEKIDIAEERNRLSSHCQMFLDELTGESEVSGKKLGFIAQEMGREINTLGSKANFAAIQKLVVQMKEELEKIKEQVLNVV